jgi:ParB family chromosome partitioning protein
VAAKNGGFDHLAQQLREDREEAAVIAKAEAELSKQGIAVVELPLTHPALTLIQVRRTKKTLTDDAHASCPGHAAFVEAYFEYDDEEGDAGKWVTEVGYVCTDPVAFGHLKAAGTAAEANKPRDTSAQDAAEDAAREERRRVVANNKAWRSAETVRREWLKTFLARKTAPSGSIRFLTNAVVDAYSVSRMAQSRHELATDLLGITVKDPAWSNARPTIKKAIGAAADGRAQVIAIGIVVADQESSLGVNTWRSPYWEAAEYLRQLVEWGYEPSEIEQSVIDRSEADGDHDEDETDVPTCRKCGCTDEEACEGGCSWVEDPEGLGDLCSACVAA